MRTINEIIRESRIAQSLHMTPPEVRSIIVGAGGGGGSGSPHPIWHSDPLYEEFRARGLNHAHCLDKLDRHYGRPYRYAGGSGGAGGAGEDWSSGYAGHTRDAMRYIMGTDWGFGREKEICVWCGKEYVKNHRGEFCDHCYGNKDGTLA